MSKRKTQEEFIAELKEVNKNINILGTYVNAHTKILCKCCVDGYLWEAKPNNLLSGKGCPKCAIKKQVEVKTKTHDEYLREVKMINPFIKVIDKYKSDNTKIAHVCPVCHKKDWMVAPSSILRGTYCCNKCNLSRNNSFFAEVAQQYLSKKRFCNFRI